MTYDVGSMSRFDSRLIALFVSSCLGACGAPQTPPPEVQPPAAAQNPAGEETKAESSPPAAEEAALPTACARADGKLERAKALLGEGFSLRARRLSEAAAKLCSERRGAAAELGARIEAADKDAPRAAAAELWSRCQAARTRGELAEARRLASWAARAFESEGHAVAAWSGGADLQARALSAGGSRLLASGVDGTLVILDAKTLAPEVFLEGRNKSPSARAWAFHDQGEARFSRDGKVVGVLAANGVTLFDARTGAREKTLSWADERITSFAFSKDGASVIVGTESRFDAVVRRFDVNSGDARAEHRIPDGRSISAVAVSPGDGSVAVSTLKGALEILRADKLEKIRALGKGLMAFPRALAFSPKGDRLASLSGDTTLEVWNAKTGARVAQTKLGRPWGSSICGFSKDGTRIVVNAGTWGDTLMEIDASDGRQLSAKKLPSSSAVLSADGSVVACSGRGSLSLVDAASGKVTVERAQARGSLEGMALTDGGLAIARELRRGTDSTVEVLLASVYAPAPRFLSAPGYQAVLALSRRGRRLAGHFGGKSVFLWDTAAGQRQDLPEFPEWVDALSFAGPSRLRGAGGPFTLKVQSLTLGDGAWTPELDIARSSGRRAVALAAERGVVLKGDEVLAFDFGHARPRTVASGKGLRALGISGDSRVAVIVSDRGTERLALTGAATPTVISGRCKSGPVSVSEDGQSVLVACNHRELALISAAGETTAQLTADGVALAPSGRVAAVHPRGGPVRLLGPDLKERAVVSFAGEKSARVRAPDGAFELVGDAPGDDVYCRAGQRAYSFELCEDLLLHDDLLVDALLP